ncbi:MAG: hypothetical protein M1832_004814 [Thelocarpon impressellum]|nr:MAG: hypothetical protein M1832_004814 [Thelocarpon impressellum]
MRVSLSAFAPGFCLLSGTNAVALPASNYWLDTLAKQENSPVPTRLETITQPNWVSGLTCEAAVFPAGNITTAGGTTTNTSTRNLTDEERAKRQYCFKVGPYPMAFPTLTGIMHDCHDVHFRMNLYHGYMSSKDCWLSCHECLHAAASWSAIDGWCNHRSGLASCRLSYQM